MGFVCDGISKCPEWERYMDSTMQLKAIMQEWTYCPWCGKKIIKHPNNSLKATSLPDHKPENIK